MPTSPIRVACLVATVSMLSIAVWSIATVNGVRGTGSSDSPLRGLGPPVHLASAAAAAEDDTREVPSQEPPETQPASRPRASGSNILHYPLPDERSVQRLLSAFPETNAKQRGVDWQFKIDNARQKLVGTTWTTSPAEIQR